MDQMSLTFILLFSSQLPVATDRIMTVHIRNPSNTQHTLKLNTVHRVPLFLRASTKDPNIAVLRFSQKTPATREREMFQSIGRKGPKHQIRIPVQ